ncbi:hypothetical protein WCLP8_4660012 [uncultured Gammaproteobacteria bacterium]
MPPADFEITEAPLSQDEVLAIRKEEIGLRIAAIRMALGNARGREWSIDELVKTLGCTSNAIPW